MSGHYDYLVEKRDAILSTARMSPAARARIMGMQPWQPVAKVHRITVNIPAETKTIERVEPVAVAAVVTPPPPPVKIEDMPQPEVYRPACPVPAGGVTSIQVLQAVATAYGVTVGGLICDVRARRLAWPRFAAAALLKAKRGMSTSQIGYVLGKRDHTTIMQALVRARGLMNRDPDWTARYRAVEHALSQS